MHILEELEARGFVHDVTDREGLMALLRAGTVPLYAGYDPTGNSLHAGSLVPTMLLARMQRAGHKPIVVVGGGTGMIGDPSGRSDERNLLSEEKLRENVAAVQTQLEPFLEFDDSESGAILVNNYDWLSAMSFLEFLRDVGKHLTVNYMTAKESVRARLEDREHGISYTEFSYMLLQAYDFVHLAKAHGCRLQIGGSDQWGNITAGCELQRKMLRDSDKARFGSHVRSAASVFASPYRGDVDDPAPVTLLHPGRNELHESDGRPQVDVKDRLTVLF